ncbi:MAG TPA: hypothetical protein VFF96_02550, partial [Pseudoxanthomonas sp.]|nr:hypothetical protein [Pseudoxanthomonas sp.]
REPGGDGGMEGGERRMRGMSRGHARIIRPAVLGRMNGMAEIQANLRVHRFNMTAPRRRT